MSQTRTVTAPSPLEQAVIEAQWASIDAPTGDDLAMAQAFLARLRDLGWAIVERS